jgi:hypothetical protein
VANRASAEPFSFSSSPKLELGFVPERSAAAGVPQSRIHHELIYYRKSAYCSYFGTSSTNDRFVYGMSDQKLCFKGKP